jgi:hypothetical protein
LFDRPILQARDLAASANCQRARRHREAGDAAATNGEQAATYDEAGTMNGEQAAMNDDSGSK